MNESYQSGDIIKITYDLTNNSLTFHKNKKLIKKKSLINSPFYLPLNNNYCLCICSYGYTNTQVLSEKLFYKNNNDTPMQVK